MIWRGLSPALVDENLFDALWRFDSARAAFLWLPIAVTGAWGAAVAFSLSRRDASPRARALAPLAWAFLLSVQCMVWLAGRPAAAGHVGGQPAFGRAGGCRRLAAGCRGAVRAVARRRVLTAGLLWGVPLALLILALFWLPSPGVGFALAWLLLGFGLGLRSLTVFGVGSLLVYLGVYYYQLEVPLLQRPSGWAAAPCCCSSCASWCGWCRA